MGCRMTPDTPPPEPLMTAVAAVSRHDDVISIGPILPDDIGRLYLWLNDVEAAKSDTPYAPLSAGVFNAWLESNRQSTSECLFAIRKHTERALIGYILLRNVQPIHRSADLGVRIGCESNRGKGYGRRAVALLLAHAFDTLNLNRVSLTVRADNARAIAAYRAAGFRHEGILRQASYLDGAWVDMIAMAILRGDRKTGARGRVPE